MRRSITSLGGALAAAFGICLIATSSALGAFGFSSYDFTVTTSSGTPESLAGSHPFEINTVFHFNTTIDPELGEITEDQVRDLVLRLPRGFAGDPNAVPRCSNADFLAQPGGDVETDLRYTTCPNSTAVGLATLSIGYKGPSTFFSPVYNLVPEAGEVQRLGLVALGGVPVVIDIRVSEEPPYEVLASVENISQVARLYSSDLTIWGNPADSVHDPERGECVAPQGFPVESGNPSRGICPVSLEEKPLLTMPRSCTGVPQAVFEIRSWTDPVQWVTNVSEMHDDSVPPQPLELSGCSELEFEPTVSAQPTSQAAESPTGLNFGLDIEDEGLTDPDGRAGSDVRRAQVTLPEGFTTNPSIAEGLVSCSKADLANETADAAPGEGCPQASKIGSLEVETPVLEEPLGGSLYVATPFDNEAGNSLLGLYMVIKSARYGVSIKQPLAVEPDPVTGQLTTVANDLPQLPFSHFKLHFREGPRSPLTTPPGCGSYSATAVLTPWSGGPPVTTDSTFEVATGPNGGACSPGGVGPFTPGFEAGSTNPIAGSYSPFVLKLSRENGSQQLRSIDTTLPLGLVGKIAGLQECSDAQIAAAASRSEPRQGALEVASPSCPVASEVGTVRAGAGSGTQAYVSGHAYLAGPYKSAPLSLVIITPAISGPFDLGTVVVRTALYVNETTAQIRAVSDPFPTILSGIPLDLRSVVVDMSRPQFILNPTSCEPMALLGSATSTLGTVAPLSQHFQVGACEALQFKPKLSLSLRGGTKRSGHPTLRTVLTYPQGAYANIAKAVVKLPATEFIDNAHINNPCTRVQFNANACPPTSVLGTARASTPLLDQPLEGPVYFRSNGGERLLPDIVADLRGKIRVVLVGFVDSVKAGKGTSRIRTTFATVPDAPVSKFELSLYGGKKGLLVNSANLCKSSNKAAVNFTAQSGRAFKGNIPVENSCKKGKRSSRHRRTR